MSLETAIFARLKTVADHVYPLAAPLDYQKPAIVYNRVSTEPARSLDGATQDWVNIQVDVYSPEYAEAISVAEAIGQSFAAWNDDDVASADIIDIHDMIDDTTQTRLYRRLQMFRVFAAS